MKNYQRTPSPIGKRFNRLVVLSDAPDRVTQCNSRIYRKRFVLCQCDCGAVKAIDLNGLKRGDYQSCGCLVRDVSHTNKHLILGVGVNDYDGFIKSHGKDIDSYRYWRCMLGRCYDPNIHAKQPTYKGCSVCDEWLYFSNFKIWFDTNYNPTTMKSWHLDKDILVDGNKVYSPETCCFVPNEINILFQVQQKGNKDMYRGVTKIDNGYCVRMQINGDRVYLGYYMDLDKANKIYTDARKKYLKEKAIKYKGLISDVVFNALSNWDN